VSPPGTYHAGPIIEPQGSNVGFMTDSNRETCLSICSAPTPRWGYGFPGRSIVKLTGLHLTAHLFRLTLDDGSLEDASSRVYGSLARARPTARRFEEL
jgi:hypothetical protein